MLQCYNCAWSSQYFSLYSFSAGSLQRIDRVISGNWTNYMEAPFDFSQQTQACAKS